MIIIVKLFNKSIVLEVDQNETIRDIKTKILTLENIEIDYQRFVYLKKPLEDDRKTLAQYKISENACLYLTIRLFIKKDK